jgi:acetyltransferase-like isoleucine patch superfamily enzyme
MRRVRGQTFKFTAYAAARKLEVGRGLLLERGHWINFDGRAESLRIGHDLNARQNFRLMLSSAARLKIGNGVFFNNGCSISCMKHIEIGDNCIFGEGVKLYDHNHLHAIGTNPYKYQGFTYGQIIIGNNVWVGSNVVILKGVEIGDNAVIGAGCVIHENVESNSMVRLGTSLVKTTKQTVLAR